MDTVSENITTREQWQPTRWAICDAATRFCIVDMRANGGRWDAKMSAWMFTSAIDAANALSALYAGVHAHRATVAQRELLLEMIADGTGQTAWDIDMHAIDGRWIAGVSRAEARQLINQGIAARRVLGIRPFEDMPAFLSQHKFYKETFAHELATRKARFPQRVAR